MARGPKVRTEGWSRWQKVHYVWTRLGALAGIIFVGWSLIAYRANGQGRAALEPDAKVSVKRADAYWRFDGPNPAPVGLVFFPGGLVDPVAYAPLVRTVAVHGYTALLVELPRRGAFGGAVGPDVTGRYLRAMREAQGSGGPARWVLGGHSRGAAVAAEALRAMPTGIAGLVLIGS